jgi:hypothetical protein
MVHMRTDLVDHVQLLMPTIRDGRDEVQSETRPLCESGQIRPPTANFARSMRA